MQTILTARNTKEVAEASRWQNEDKENKTDGSLMLIG
jgi:hypothetical protein